MPWRRTLDADGNPILRDTETGEERPAESVAPASVAAPQSAPIQAPAPAPQTTTNAENLILGGGGGLGGALSRLLAGPVGPSGLQSGRDIGSWLSQPAGQGAAVAPETESTPLPELDFGDSTQLRPVQQAVVDEIRAMLEMDEAGGASASAADPEGSLTPEVTGTPGDRAAQDLDSITSFMSLGLPDSSQGDPGLGLLAQGAREDRDRFTPILERELGRAAEQRDLYSGENPRRNASYNIAMFLGRLLSGERGDVAGDMVRDRQGTEQAWTDRIIQLTEAGVSMDQAIRQADAAVLSSGYQAGIATEERDYGREVQGRQLGFQERGLDLQEQGLEANTRQADRSLRLTLAQLLSEGLQQTEESNLAAAGTLLESPQADQASRFIAGTQIPGASEETQGVLASTLSQRARLAPIIERVLAGVSRGEVRDIRREATRAARAQGITLTPSDLSLIERAIVQSRIGQPAE